MDREKKGSPGRENCVSKDTEARRRIQGNFLDEQKELLFIVHGREKILRQFYEGRIVLNLTVHYTVYWDSVEKCKSQILSNILLALKKEYKTKWLKRNIVAWMTLDMKSSLYSDSELFSVSLK